MNATPTPAPTKNWLTPKEAGADPRLRISAPRIIQAMRDGQLRGRKLPSGKKCRYLICPDSLEAWIASMIINP